MTGSHEIAAEAERLVSAATWAHENSSVRAIWRSGSPHLSGPANLGKWLRRHEARRTESGAVLRLGNAWRIVEPAFTPVLLEIPAKEYARPAGGKQRKGARQ